MVRILTNQGFASAKATRRMIIRPSPNRTTATSRATIGCEGTWAASTMAWVPPGPVRTRTWGRYR